MEVSWYLRLMIESIFLVANFSCRLCTRSEFNISERHMIFYKYPICFFKSRNLFQSESAWIILSKPCSCKTFPARTSSNKFFPVFPRKSAYKSWSYEIWIKEKLEILLLILFQQLFQIQPIIARNRVNENEKFFPNLKILYLLVVLKVCNFVPENNEIVLNYQKFLSQCLCLNKTNKTKNLRFK